MRRALILLLAAGCGPLTSSAIRAALDRSGLPQNLSHFVGCRLSREDGQVRLALLARADDGAIVSYQYDSRQPQPAVLFAQRASRAPQPGHSCLLIEPSRAEYMRDFTMVGEKAWHFAGDGLGRAYLAPITAGEMRRDPVLVVDVPKHARENPTLYVLVPPTEGRSEASLRADRCLLCREGAGTELTVPLHIPTDGEKAIEWLMLLPVLPILAYIDALASPRRQ